MYQCSSLPVPAGEFEPDAGCPATPTSPQPVDVKVGRILPCTFANASDFRPSGPDPMTSGAYAEDFNETRDYGRVDSTVRSAAQTDVAYFWSENPYVHWNRNLVRLAVANGLSLRDAARLFALVHTTASDAIIAGFEAKYFYAAWRPRTAIPRADTDGNPDTDAEPTWKPLLMVNHPEYPSGHGFWSTALLESVNAFFGTNKVTWTIATSKAAVPNVVQTERTYDHLNTLMREIGNARIWGGLHWRHSIRHGARSAVTSPRTCRATSSVRCSSSPPHGSAVAGSSRGGFFCETSSRLGRSGIVRFGSWSLGVRWGLEVGTWELTPDRTHCTRRFSSSAHP